MDHRIFVNSIPKAGTHLVLRVLDLLPNLAELEPGANSRLMDVGRSLARSNELINRNRKILQRFLWQFRSYRERDYLDIGPYRAVKTWNTDEARFARRFLNRLKNGQYTLGHVFYFPEFELLLRDRNIQQLITIRDPRDVCVSTVFHIMKYPEHRMSGLFQRMTPDARLMAVIRGVPKSASSGKFPLLDIGETYRRFIPWLSGDHGLVIRFEALIGPKGGGNCQEQLDIVKLVASRLETDLSDTEANLIAENAFSNQSSTFRNGQIGAWSEHFKQEHIQAMKEVAGDILTSLSYESNLDW